MDDEISATSVQQKHSAGTIMRLIIPQGFKASFQLYSNITLHHITVHIPVTLSENIKLIIEIYRINYINI